MPMAVGVVQNVLMFACASRAVAFGPAPPTPNDYLPNCASKNQYGWPRFDTISALEVRAGYVGMSGMSWDLETLVSLRLFDVKSCVALPFDPSLPFLQPYTPG